MFIYFFFVVDLKKNKSGFFVYWRSLTLFQLYYLKELKLSGYLRESFFYPQVILFFDETLLSFR